MAHRVVARMRPPSHNLTRQLQGEPFRNSLLRTIFQSLWARGYLGLSWFDLNSLSHLYCFEEIPWSWQLIKKKAFKLPSIYEVNGLITLETVSKPASRQASMVLEEQLRATSWSSSREESLGLTEAFETSPCTNKATPPSLSNPFQQLHSLVTKHSLMWAYGGHLIQTTTAFDENTQRPPNENMFLFFSHLIHFSQIHYTDRASWEGQYPTQTGISAISDTSSDFRTIQWNAVLEH